MINGKNWKAIATHFPEHSVKQLKDHYEYLSKTRLSKTTVERINSLSRNTTGEKEDGEKRRDRKVNDDDIKEHSYNSSVFQLFD